MRGGKIILDFEGWIELLIGLMFFDVFKMEDDDIDKIDFLLLLSLLVVVVVVVEAVPVPAAFKLNCIGFS